MTTPVELRGKRYSCSAFTFGRNRIFRFTSSQEPLSIKQDLQTRPNRKGAFFCNCVVLSDIVLSEVRGGDCSTGAARAARNECNLSFEFIRHCCSPIPLMSLLEELSAILRLPMLRQPITQWTSSNPYLGRNKRYPFAVLCRRSNNGPVLRNRIVGMNKINVRAAR